MGRSKRKNNSPLLKDGGKSRRTADEDGDDIEGDDGSQGGQDDVLTDLKDFIRSENARNSKNLADEIRRCNEESMTAIETSLSFASVEPLRRCQSGLLCQRFGCCVP